MMQLIYKCRLCGEEFGNVLANENTTIRIFLDLTTNDVSREEGAVISRHNYHLCDTESMQIGFGDLIGAREVEE